MTSTKELLERALSAQPARHWCLRYSITEALLSKAKKGGHLSPALAGNFAMDLGEDAKHWIAVAAMEAGRKNPINERLRLALGMTKP